TGWPRETRNPGVPTSAVRGCEKRGCRSRQSRPRSRRGSRTGGRSRGAKVVTSGEQSYAAAGGWRREPSATLTEPDTASSFPNLPVSSLQLRQLGVVGEVELERGDGDVALGERLHVGAGVRVGAEEVGAGPEVGPPAGVHPAVELLGVRRHVLRQHLH